MNKDYRIEPGMRRRNGTICQTLRDIHALAEESGDQATMNLAQTAYGYAKRMNERLVYYQQTYEPFRKNWRDSITIAFPYYRNTDMLRRHLKEWARYPDDVKARLTAVVVDDGSPEPAEINVDVGFPVRLYRIIPDIPWNISGAKNLIMQEAPDDWVLITDIDHVLTAENAAKLFSVKRKPGIGYRPRRVKASDGTVVKRHITSMLVHRDDWWRCGGMDEDFAGHYGEGTPFMRNFSAVNRVSNCDDFALHLYGADDIEDSRTPGLGRFGSRYDADDVPALRAKRAGGPYKAENAVRFLWKRLR